MPRMRSFVQRHRFDEISSSNAPRNYWFSDSVLSVTGDAVAVVQLLASGDRFRVGRHACLSLRDACGKERNENTRKRETNMHLKRRVYSELAESQFQFVFGF